MIDAVADCLISGYQALIPDLDLPDLDDRHVLAAAIHGGAEAIVTANLRDFPPAALEPLGIRAQGPDSFVRYLIDLARAWSDGSSASKPPTSRTRPGPRMTLSTL